MEQELRVSAVSADGLAPLGARPSAGAVKTCFNDILKIFSFLMNW